MKIIGEKINGTIKRVAQAVSKKDALFIQELAKKQTEAGAAYLDVNAGTNPEDEPYDLAWLVEIAQAVVDIPLCLDSPNPKALKAAVKSVDKTPIINSINGEKNKLEAILPIVAEHGCRVIAMAMNENRIPNTVEARLDIICDIIKQTRYYGIPDSHLYIDPLAMSLATDSNAAIISIETMHAIRQKFPEVHLTIGLSNISFGLPARVNVNKVFLCQAMHAGLDSVILDPLNKVMISTILATELALGRDRFAQNYSRAYREGRIV